MNHIIHEVVKDCLKYRKICARWVPIMLTDEHEKKHIGTVLNFFECYSNEGLISDQIWVVENFPLKLLKKFLKTFVIMLSLQTVCGV